MDRLLLQTFADAEAISQAASHDFVRLANEAIATRGRFRVALSGGSTPKRLYQLLATSPVRESINWSLIDIFWGDERTVPPDHADSNYRMAREAMLDKVPLLPNAIHRIEAERPDHDVAAARYQEEIAQAFGVDPEGAPPAFDLILLGMGPDAHTASLFPHSSALGETTRWVVANFVEKFNTYRVTFTTRLINQAHRVLFLVAGADKAEPLFQVFTGPPDHARLPSQLIHPSEGHLMWYVDRAAIARMTAGFEGSELR